MKIVAVRGDSTYLLVKDDVDKIKGDTQARVLDLDANKLYPWYYTDSIIARGFWKPYDGDQNILDTFLKQVEVIKTK